MDTNPQAQPTAISAAQQPEAAAFIHQLDYELSQKLSAIPPELRAQMAADIGSILAEARQIAGSPMGRQQAMAHLLASVDQLVIRARGEAEMHSQMLRDVSLNQGERIALRRTLHDSMMQDAVFRALSPEMQQQTVEMTAKMIETDPDLAARAREILENPEKAQEILQQMKRDERTFQRLLQTDANLRPYAAAMREASGKLLGHMPPELGEVMREYQAGTISAEEFARRYTAKAEELNQQLAPYKAKGLEALRGGRPEIAASLEEYLRENGTNIQNYSSNPPLDPLAVKAAGQRLEAAGNDWSKLEKGDQHLLARASYEMMGKAAAETVIVSNALALLKERGQVAELANLQTDAERVEYLRSHGLITRRETDTALALFENNQDELLYGGDQKAIFEQGYKSLNENYYRGMAEKEVARATSNERMKTALGQVFNTIDAQGWGQSVSMDFMVLDTDRDGKLSVEEVQRVLRENRVKLSELGSDGTIDRERLVAQLTPIVASEIAKGRG